MNGLTPVKGIILGLIQGATEFFPVSSAAHLVIAQTYLGVREVAHSLAAFDVSLHIGTLVAAILFYAGIWPFFLEAGSNLWEINCRKNPIPPFSLSRQGGIFCRWSSSARFRQQC